MTWTQLMKLWNDYGAFVALCVAVGIIVAVGATLLIKFWPVISKTFLTVQALLDLPTFMDQFREHLEDAKVKTAMLTAVDSRLDAIEANTQTAAKQTTNNGGSSMKDAVDRSDARSERIEAMLIQLLAKPQIPSAITVATASTPQP